MLCTIRYYTILYYTTLYYTTLYYNSNGVQGHQEALPQPRPGRNRLLRTDDFGQ